MKLTDIDSQQRILSKLDASKINLCSGGSAANTIIAFAKFGGKAAYLSLLGNDSNGRFYAGEFNQLGIRLQADFLDNDPTGTCLVMITPDSERTMCTSLGATGKFSTANLDEEIIGASEWLYIEGYKFSSAQSTDAIFRSLEIADKYKTKIALTFSDVFITSQFRDNLLIVAAKADLVFCNENEVLSFTDQSTLDNAVQRMSEITKNFVVTLGDRGALVSWDNKLIEIPPYPVKAVDSTGAGDIFAGAFLYGIIYKRDPVFAGHLGSYSASRIVSQLGARLNENFDDVMNYVKNEINKKN